MGRVSPWAGEAGLAGGLALLAAASSSSDNDRDRRPHAGQGNTVAHQKSCENTKNTLFIMQIFTWCWSVGSQVVESLLGENGDLIQTGSPCILCSPLPSHWRSNKSLPGAFKVFTFQVWRQ